MFLISFIDKTNENGQSTVQGHRIYSICTRRQSKRRSSVSVPRRVKIECSNQNQITFIVHQNSVFSTSLSLH